MKNIPFPGILVLLFVLTGLAFAETTEPVNIEATEPAYAETTEPVYVDIDIKAQSCPNPMNVSGKGVLPVAVLGAEEFDVNLVDVATLELEGVPVLPEKYEFEDVASPFFDNFLNENCFDCTEEGPDGFPDLIIYFDTGEVADALSPVEDGDCLYLTVTGFLTDGMRIEGSDSLRIIKKKPEKEVH